MNSNFHIPKNSGNQRVGSQVRNTRYSNQNQNQNQSSDIHSDHEQLLVEQKEEILDAFDIFDVNRDGKLDYHELRVAFRALGFDVPKSDLLKYMNMFSESPNGDNGQAHTANKLIGYEDFYKIAATKILERDPLEEIKRAFLLFDKDGTGKITFDNLKSVVKDLGETLTDDDIARMIDEFDLDEDGAINEEEFIAICTE